jgi:dTDP-4-dehydrorhamnose 3,5-epimerase
MVRRGRTVIIEETRLGGAHLLDVETREDPRGFFARLWCGEELALRGLDARISQVNVGFNLRRGTVRGLHFQRVPHAEVKLVRCTAGAVYDVIVDLRPESPTHRQWIGVELGAENHRQLYIPEGVAHGYQTLTDAAEVCYQTSMPYAPESATGVRFDDPAFGISWPEPVTVVSDADRSWPDYVEESL